MKIAFDISVTAARRRRVVSAPPPWVPDALFAAARKGGWYDPSDLTTLFSDTAGTQPATTDGALVALIRDRSGNGNHLLQSTASRRPVLRISGGLSWLEFDGVDDRFSFLTTKSYAQATLGAVMGARYDASSTLTGVLRATAAGTPTLAYAAMSATSSPTAATISNVGTPNLMVNAAAAPSTRGGLRSALTTAAVLSGTAIDTATLTARAGMIFGYLTQAWPMGRFYGYLEADGMTSTEASAARAWMAQKTGVVL